ncbi:hypothetical protein [Paraglaciecola sp.]|uniref:hypothetical protein n=1 Tax=Paraglaciecola sp. TaxID=1920173 RepID=UPI003EF3180F
MKQAFVSVILLLSNMFFQANGVEVKGVVQVNYVFADDHTSWFEHGTGILAYSNNGINLQQGVFQVSDSYASGISYQIVGNVYQKGEQNLGLTQAQINYKPLSNSVLRWRARAGFFYPKMSLENVDLGWLSPYTYTQSAINSWLGEELRTPAVELTLYSPGRSRRSAFSWEFRGAAFKGNDPLGTLLSWRGFALHDRQSLNNDSVPFARYPSVVDQDRIFHPDYVEPFHEFDGHVGYYLGTHIDYYQKTRFRYYFYDNQADPLALNEPRLYAWRTKFHSFALQHRFSKNTRLISQWLTGSTTMGERSVYVDYDAWYLLLSHNTKQHRMTVRYDNFEVKEDDLIPWDLNSSHGKALTFAWRYTLNNNWQLGIEHHINRNTAENRVSLDQRAKINQQQSMLVVQYSWEN